MINKLLLSTALVAVGATAGMAQGFSGGELGLEYQLFDGLDASTTTYYGAAELEVTPQISAAVDFSLFNTDDSDDNPTNVTIHGIYKTPVGGTFGAFYGQDSLDGDSIDMYGVEGAYDFGLGQIEAYYGTADSDADISFLGAAADYDLGSGFGFVAAVDILNLAAGGVDTSTTLLEIGGTYTIANGPTVFAKVGNANIDVDDNGTDLEGDETYVSIGASIGFGPDNGVTFSPRGIFSTSTLTF